MFGFLSKKRGLGIEITTKYIRVSVVSKSGEKMSLEHFDRVSVPKNTFVENNLQNVTALLDTLKKAIPQSYSGKAYISIPDNSLRFFTITIPRTSSQERSEHVIHALKEYVSFNEGQDTVCDTLVVKQDATTETVRVSVMDNTSAETFSPVFDWLKKYTVHIERPNTAALVACQDAIFEGVHVHLQFGDDTSSVSIVEDDRVVAYKDVPFSTYRFLHESQEILKNLGKISSVYLKQEGVLGKDIREFSMKVFQSLCVVIDHEMQIHTQGTSKKITHMSVGGGFASYKGVADEFSKQLRIKVMQAYPWAVHDQRFDDSLYRMKKGETLEYLVSLGLAIECL